MIILTLSQLDDIKNHARYLKHLLHQMDSLRANKADFDGFALVISAKHGKIEFVENTRGKLTTALLSAVEKHLADEIQDVNTKLADLGIAIE